jgi:lipoprotein-anchoring transpeptidase ErfK/SrfK
VGFKGGGYAFHSRLRYPGTQTISDPSIGFPVSHGCVRMFQEDIDWLFDTIPVETTVVVY